MTQNITREFMKSLRLFLIYLCSLFLIGCATKDYSADNFKHLTVGELLQQGEQNIAKGNYEQAAKYLEAIDALYPFNPEAKQGQLMTIYAYYKSGDHVITLAAANRYIHLYPEDSHTDYAYYIKGVVNFNKNRTAAQKLLSKKLENLDISDLNESFINFSELLRKYPNSFYAKDAKKRMFYIRHLIAEHELNIAKFYLKRKAYVASANRATNLVKHYPGTPQTKEALKIMIKSCDALSLKQQKEDTLRTFKLNFPNETVE